MTQIIYCCDVLKRTKVSNRYWIWLLSFPFDEHVSVNVGVEEWLKVMFSAWIVFEFGATMTLLNALGWIISSKCSLLVSTSHADVDYSCFSLVFLCSRQIYCLATSFFDSISITSVYSSVAAFLRASGPLGIPRGCSFFVWGAARGATACHISHTRYSGVPFVCIEWFGLARCQDSMAGFICSKFKLYARRRHSMHTVRRCFAFILTVCMNSLWKCHLWIL